LFSNALARRVSEFKITSNSLHPVFNKNKTTTKTKTTNQQKQNNKNKTKTKQQKQIQNKNKNNKSTKTKQKQNNKNKTKTKQQKQHKKNKTTKTTKTKQQQKQQKQQKQTHKHKHTHTHTHTNKHKGVINTKLLGEMGFNGSNDLNRGAETSVFLASSPDVEGISGKYWNKKQQEQPNPIALDQAIQERLWNYSELLVKKLSSKL